MTSEEKESQDGKVFGNCIFYTITVYYSDTVGKNHKNTWQGIPFLIELYRAVHGANGRGWTSICCRVDGSRKIPERDRKGVSWMLDSSAFSMLFLICKARGLIRGMAHMGVFVLFEFCEI